MPDEVRIDVDELAIRSIKTSDDMRDYLMEVAGPITERARAFAPKKSGAGAASIHAEPHIEGDEWVVRIGWDHDHFYLYFRDRGTVYQTARPFLEQALEGEAG
jgi:HK97 gp10 family phage protein